MTFWRLAVRNLLFDRRANLGVVLGAALGTAVIAGALMVGDSVRQSLIDLVSMRLGKTEYALGSEDRFFRAALADELSSRLNAPAAPLIRLRGVAVRDGGRIRVNQVRILGVDDRFWKMGPDPGDFSATNDGFAVVSERLASRLGLKKGDEFLLRMKKTGMLPSESPLASNRDSSTVLRLKASGVASDIRFGRFGLQADQVAPLNVFVSLSQLSGAIEKQDRANTILLGGGYDGPLDPAAIDSALRGCWKMEDAGLTLRRVREGQFLQLESDRVFMDPPVADAAVKAEKRARRILTYFVNEIRKGERSTPYSFVSAPGGPPIHSGMADDEIVLNEWAAEDLSAREGDRIELRYYVPGPMGKLNEESASFRVRSLISISGPSEDPALVPDFPGLSSEIENCSDWDPGIPIDIQRIRDKDEEYWDRYKTTPKAFVTLGAAQKMWKNRFGAITGVRYPADGTVPEELSGRILDELDPSVLGLAFSPVREDALLASTSGVNFSQLFMGLSSFIVMAALLFTGLLFVFKVEGRSEETKVLLALGYRVSQVRRLMLTEGAVLALSGGAVGVILGLIYNQAVLSALRTVWYAAVGTSAIRLHLEASTMVLGAVCGAGAALIPMWVASGRQARMSRYGGPPARGTAKGWPALCLGAVFLAGAAGIVGYVGPDRGKEGAGAFFGAGTLMLACGLSFSYWLLLKAMGSRSSEARGYVHLGIRNLSRRRWRNLAVVGILACGIFLISAVAGNRHDPLRGFHLNSSGTGGFPLYAESSLPILRNLNTEEGRRMYGLKDADWTDARFLHLRVYEGDDASCLNLNRAQKPRILGVDPAELSARRAFTFVKTTDDVNQTDPWTALSRSGEQGNIVFGVADDSVINWGLGKSVGDTLSYEDERGRPFEVKLIGGLANSIFQGSVLISEDAFIERFPSAGGARVLLVDAPFDEADSLAQKLAAAPPLQDAGLDIVSSAGRLAEFNSVENTYLSIFLLLGGLGLILGCAGLGVVLLRNVLERRAELALLRAVGYSRRMLLRMVLSEHWGLLLLGLACGLAAAALAILPAAASPGGDVPYLSLCLMTAGIVASGIVWTCLAAVIAMRGDLLSALRGE